MEEKAINYYHRTEFKKREITEEEAEKERIKDYLRRSYGNEVVNKIMAILYSARIEKLEDKYVRVIFKDGRIGSVKVLNSPAEEKENEIVFRVERENLRDILERKVYEGIDSLRITVDDTYWKAYRRTPEIMLKATLARMRGIA